MRLVVKTTCLHELRVHFSRTTAEVLTVPVQMEMAETATIPVIRTPEPLDTCRESCHESCHETQALSSLSAEHAGEMLEHLWLRNVLRVQESGVCVWSIRWTSHRKEGYRIEHLCTRLLILKRAPGIDFH